VEEPPGRYTRSRRQETVLNKDILTQYTDLLREAEEVEQRIKQTERELRQMDADGEVTDMVRGGEGGIQHFKITGFPVRDYYRKKSLLNTRNITLLSLKNEIDETLNDVHEFIASIENSHDRRIITMRIVDKMSWRQIAHVMGGNNTEDSVRKRFERFLEKN